jgi:phosphohistidine phosphatase
VQPCIGDIAVIYSDELYGTDAAGYLDVIRTEAIGENVLLVGHNPMMEDLAFALSGGGDSHARDLLSAGFPTSGLAVIRFDTPLTEAAPGKGYLEAFLSPADL